MEHMGWIVCPLNEHCLHYFTSYTTSTYLNTQLTGASPDMITFNSAMNSCKKSEKWSRAVGLLVAAAQRHLATGRDVNPTKRQQWNIWDMSTMTYSPGIPNFFLSNQPWVSGVLSSIFVSPFRRWGQLCPSLISFNALISACETRWRDSVRRTVKSKMLDFMNGGTPKSSILDPHFLL